MSARGRVVDPEVLDDLAPADPRAVRSRRDLQRVNWVMGSCGILTRVLRNVLGSAPPHAPLRILELGAGDGSLALRMARRLAPSWSSVELTLLDQQALVAAETGTGFAELGWTLRPLTVDVLEWARSRTQHLPGRWDVILANLFLHHFEGERLHELLSAAAQRCDVFIACEPRRTLPALIGSRLMPVLGVSADTLHDAIISVRAGFRDSELSGMWPATESVWKLREQRAGPFSHLFVAVRGYSVQ
jgi:2-polyprenyl-3-methyl-5-hydroxy-6-metoxy-1,4-benzoquinol methylase